MGRNKGDPWVKINFNVHPETKKSIIENSKIEGVGQSNFIELLVSRWNEGINPQSKLNALYKKRDLKAAELAEIDTEIMRLTTQISAWDAIKRDKLKKKPEAIKIISNLLKNNEINQAEKVSRFWQTQTGVSSFELLMEARDPIKELENEK